MCMFWVYKWWLSSLRWTTVLFSLAFSFLKALCHFFFFFNSGNQQSLQFFKSGASLATGPCCQETGPLPRVWSSGPCAPGVCVWTSCSLAGLHMVQHWGLWGHRWSHKHHPDRQLALPAGLEHWDSVSIQYQCRDMGRRTQQGFTVCVLSLLYHDKPYNHRIWKHSSYHRCGKDVFRGHDDGWL